MLTIKAYLLYRNLDRRALPLIVAHVRAATAVSDIEQVEASRG
jgi:hypothetical protein